MVTIPPIFFLSNQVYDRQQCFAPGCYTIWEFRLLQACSTQVLWFHMGHRSCSLKPVCSSISHIKNGHRLSGSITFFSFHSNFLMVSCTIWPWLLLCQKHCPLSSPLGFAWLQDALGLPFVLQDPNHVFKITRALIFYKLLISNNTEWTIHTHKSNGPNAGILRKQDKLSLQSFTWEMTSWGNGHSQHVPEAGTQDVIHGIV